eukprot:TRINITY_DN7200_c0_g1_i3.p1 TRINITY_DN7200_c0_g1~~TRINITY_DN7200_c0_g1_i3.p1  ORF type:complete len:272 (-),score=44.18 TRINITY_DN7200_c0_g1_i3:14-829(-)
MCCSEGNSNMGWAFYTRIWNQHHSLHNIRISNIQEKEDFLIKYTDANCWLDNIQRRRVQHYGYPFNYQIRRLEVDKPRTEFPPPYEEIAQQLYELGFFPSPPNQLTLNDYQAGQGIRFHVDSHSSFLDEVASISMGSDCIMEFRLPLQDITQGRHRKHHQETEETVNILLPRRSLLILQGDARYLWDHQIPGRKTEIISRPEYERYSHRQDVLQDQILPDQRFDGASAQPSCKVSLVRDRRISVTFRRARMDGKCRCNIPHQCDSQDLFVE